MKRTVLAFIVCLTLNIAGFGQDVIVRRNGTRFDCQIITTDSIKIKYILKTFNGNENAFINLSDVSSYFYEGKNIFVADIEKSPAKLDHHFPDKKNSTNAFNVGFMGLTTESISLNYEHLFNSKYGLVAGLPLINLNGDKELGFNVGFRSHFKRTMSSGYWGFFATYTRMETKITTEGLNLDKYKYNYTNLYIGPNIGRRWIFDSGLNLAIRIGYGISVYKNMEWIDIPEDKDVREFEEKMMKIFSNFDAELSFGYCF